MRPNPAFNRTCRALRPRISICCALLLVSVCSASHAKEEPCAAGWSFSPSTPNDTNVITVRVGYASDLPIPITATVNGAAIRVAIATHGETVCTNGIPAHCLPPVVCATTTIAPLPPGTYATRLDVTNSSVGANFSGFGELIVVPSVVAAVPTTSAASVAALALILFACTFWTRQPDCSRSTLPGRLRRRFLTPR